MYVILAHFYDPSIQQITHSISLGYTVLQLREYIIETYNLEATQEDIELWIAPNEDKTTISQENNNISLHNVGYISNWTWIYWFNKTDFINKFNKWIFWSNIQQIANNFQHNIDNPIAVSFKDLLRCHITVDYNTSYHIPSANGIFNSKLFTLNSLYKKMVHFIEKESIQCKIYGKKFPYSENPKNIYFCLVFDDKHIVIEDNYDRSLYAIINGENEEKYEKKTCNDNV
eukprot:234648_1